jgi:hypothetical protein
MDNIVITEDLTQIAISKLACSIKDNNNKLENYNKYMDDLIINFHLLNLKFFSL